MATDHEAIRFLLQRGISLRQIQSPNGRGMIEGAKAALEGRDLPNTATGGGTITHGPGTNRPINYQDSDVAYYDAAGKPYAGQGDSYWQNANQWYRGTPQGQIGAVSGMPGVPSAGGTPPANLGRERYEDPAAPPDAGSRTSGGDVVSTQGDRSLIDRTTRGQTSYSDRLRELIGSEDGERVRAGLLSLQQLLGGRRPTSWLTPGVGYGDRPGPSYAPPGVAATGGQGRVTYFNEAGRPFRSGRDTASYWYNQPDGAWYQGNLQGEVSPATNLPWLAGRSFGWQRYYDPQGNPYGGGNESWWLNRPENQWYQGRRTTGGNQIAAGTPPWMRPY